MTEGIKIGDIGEIPLEKVHNNTKQETIYITVDRAKLVLKDHSQMLSNRKGWIAPLGIGASLLLALVSTNFKDTFGVSSSVWEALFIFCFASSVIWLVCEFIRLAQSLWSGNSIDQVIEKLKNENS